MRKLSASNIVAFINQLDKNTAYNYINSSTKGLIKIEGIDLPEGPIRIKRWDPSKGETEKGKSYENISSEMIWRIANALEPEQPINLDRILAGSYNTRSVLESLIAHTPEFYYCYPGRVENKGGYTSVKEGHKHLIWKPNLPHQRGILVKTITDLVISEMPAFNAVYNTLELTEDKSTSNKIDIDIKRRHAQIQIALYFIGHQLNFRTWIAQNDKGLIYQNKRIETFDGVVASLKDENLMRQWDDAVKAALMIDCIWFKNGKLMPAVMEVEHSTGVTSGLDRMKNFKDRFPPYPTRYVVVAADEDRDLVIREANKPMFKDLDTRFFSYSAVEELYSLCQRRKLKGVTEEFLDCFMEPVLYN